MNSSLTVVGLTGGIASGKSSVSRVFRQLGIPVLDADSLGHMVLDPGQPAYKETIDTFGTDILCADGETIDRQKLGKKVFDNNEERARLERITHPAIAELARRGLELIAQKGESLAVYEAALLVETGIHKSLSALVVVSTSVENQMTRLCARDAISTKDAATRIACQLPLPDKLAVADHVIENNGTPEALEEAAARLAGTLKEKYS